MQWGATTNGAPVWLMGLERRHRAAMAVFDVGGGYVRIIALTAMGRSTWRVDLLPISLRYISGIMSASPTNSGC